MAEEKYVPRLKTKYNEVVKGQLHDQFGYKNVMMIPKIEKIVVNMGVGEAATDSKAIDGAVRDLRAITGQQPMITRARKSIASFRLRAGMPIGAKVTLRGDRMWEFFDRYPRLPRHLPQELRRPWQLLHGRDRAAHLPGDRLRFRRPHPRYGHHHRHHRQHR